ncbi:hypothetical protein E2C01_036132 [Portunus trituberculatus]|uniref:Reverse transcriptase domain-containing protein n=1 Tax=Portunus trituberculatus TaxID=210409 RepID=A0A5B7F4Y6_PORTR|nr:hypothetical protein [Portunus trituberculatus]
MLTTITGKKAVVIFLNMEKAFELANSRAILTALARKGVGDKLLRWTQGHLTQYITLQNGTPQGSILSPHLFNTLMEELTSIALPTSTKVFCYADDVALVSTGPHHLRKAQHAMNAITLGLKINVNKTRGLYFNGKRPPEPLKAHNNNIEWTYCHQYLGIWLDEKLTLQQHIRYPTDRVRSQLRVMRSITATEGVAGFQVLKTYYLQAVRNIFDYAAPLLAAARPSQL